jgi:hypothetical protein
MRRLRARAVPAAAALWLTLAALAPALIAPGVAGADGDPASDVLLGQDVFLPYSPISSQVQRSVYAVAAAARSAGYPVKIALIEAPSDLGVLPALFGKPQTYARFLSAELAGSWSRPVLVVMPGGFGLAAAGHALPIRSLAGVGVGRGSDGLGRAAISAADHLAAGSGHPLRPTGAASPLGASSSTMRAAGLAILLMAAAAAVAIAAAWIARSRADPGPREPAR